jgi:hypothetical protein
MPKYYFKLLASGDRQIARSRKFLDGLHELESSSKQNYKGVPANATIRSEKIKCGKPCLMSPHGLYYYAYWKENRKLKKKYIGSKFDESWHRLTLDN